MGRKRAIVIGAGVGGLAMGIRLQSLGFDTTIVEALDAPGGRAYVRREQGFTFDMGPTVITVPHFIEELFSLERDRADLLSDDFPSTIVDENKRIKEGISGGPNTSRYVQIVPILPFYRIYFDDGTYFDYDGDEAHTREQILALGEPGDLEGYERFHEQSRAIFERGFLELGYTHFGDVGTMLKVAPDLLKLDAVRNLFRFSSRYFKSDKLRQVFTFEPLLVGGNPLSVPAIYAMIHFVEKTWGIHFAMGGTGALVQGFVKKFEDLGGKIQYNAPVTQINVTRKDGKKVATGVTLGDGLVMTADLVVSNADWATTYGKLIEPQYRFWNSDLRVKLSQQSMSVFVIYFGFRADGNETDKLCHHTIILGPRYEELLKDIFGRKIFPKDFSQYVHLPSLTDPSLAPPGHHAAYTLLPMPNNKSGIDWNEMGDRLRDIVFEFLEERGYLPNLRERLVCHSYITPDYFEGTLDAYAGNAFGLEPLLVQSAFFRPHNRSEDVKGLYLVGAGTQPGAGTPSVMMSAKMTARLVAEDYGVEDAILSGQTNPERTPQIA
ncbi:phytoene desaturase family protein [Nodosilinea sp. PGN35]|uniref:phytoene desaturase family protein n=1 Tax=Nodosilinea sp. PGN35 TaxID=3020489 RepID=UPI0023B2273C|nr:phytoene desaturase family protein [Nodosilinea sp. TSF1-S3]MDF0369529.1 phytoene desaturase family protein [Nodosilinea sp. TSF1-S3]